MREQVDDEDNKRTIARIKKWLDEYPQHKGIVVLFDEDNGSVVDLGNTSGDSALAFAAGYLDFVKKHLGAI